MGQSAVHSQQHQNDQVRFSIHHKPSCIIEFDVEALEPLVNASKKKAIKAVAKEVTLSGFRKGKAPDELVLKNYAKEVDKEWQQVIANASFQECQKLAQQPLLHKDARISYTMKSHSDSGAHLTLAFEAEPTIPTVDPKQLQLKDVKRPEVSEDKINETIRQVQFFFAQWEKVENRPVQDGDFVLLDVDVIETAPATSLFANTRFEVSKKGMAKWMYDLVIGKNCDDSMDGVSVPDEDASAEDKEELKPKKVLVTINAIEKATLPVLDDTFAQKLGVASVEELKVKITELLNNQADAHVTEARREQVNEFLLTHYAFELPVSLVEKETQFRLRQLAQDQDFLKYWETLSEEQRKNTLQTIHQQSEKAVRMFYLSRKIISDASIRISASDIPPPASNALEMLLNPQKMFHHTKNTEVEHAEAYSRLILEKAADHILSKASE